MQGIAFRGVQVGSTVVVGSVGGAADAATRLARSLPADKGRLVVTALPPEPADAQRFWAAVADVCRGAGPVRLAISGAGGGSAPCPAQWLADRLGVEVVAPDGLLVPTAGTGVYVAHPTAPGESGRWVAFRPGRSPSPLGPRFPEPRWERLLPVGSWSPHRSTVVENVPAGLWLPGCAASMVRPALRTPLANVPVSPDVLTVVLGSPGMARLPVDELVALRHALPLLTTPMARLVAYGHSEDETMGQALADRFGERVVTTTGLPSPDGPGTTLYDVAGQPTWEPFATEVAYPARRAGSDSAPTVSRYRPPVPGLKGLAQPGVFEFVPGVLLEVIQSGLWLRGARQRPVPEVRARPVDPNFVALIVGVPGEATPDELQRAMLTLVQKLDARSRHFLRISVEGAAQPVPRQDPVLEERTEMLRPSAKPSTERPRGPSAVAPVGPSGMTGPALPALAREEPRTVALSVAHRAAAPAVERTVALLPTTPTERLRPDLAVEQPTESLPGSPALRAAQVEAVPGAMASATGTGEPPAATVPAKVIAPVHPFPTVDPSRRSTPEDHAWLRAHLGARYGFHERTVVGMIATAPALRLLADAPTEAVVADLVAVRAYLTDGRAALDEALTAGRINAMLPYVNCVVSGLQRLPSYRGVAFCAGGVGDGTFPSPGGVLAERAVRQALTRPFVTPEGGTEFVIWSATARRLDVLEPEQPVRRVVFPPSCRFRVLDVSDPDESARRVLLRQVGATGAERPLDDGDVAVRDRLTRIVEELDPADAARRVPDDVAVSAWSLAS